MISVMTVQDCSEPFTVEVWIAVGTVLNFHIYSFALLFCACLLHICNRNELRLYEPLHSGVGICYSLIIARERGYPRNM